MGGFSLWHILIFAVIVLLLFGGNRFSAMMGDVAKGIKSFKHGLADDEKPAEHEANSAQQSQQPDRHYAEPSGRTSHRAAERRPVAPVIR